MNSESKGSRMVKSNLLIAAAAVALIAGTTLASAQTLRDDPPGSRFQSEQENQDEGFLSEGDRTAEVRGGHAEMRKGQCWYGTAWGTYGGHWGPCGAGGSPAK